RPLCRARAPRRDRPCRARGLAARRRSDQRGCRRGRGGRRGRSDPPHRGARGRGQRACRRAERAAREGCGDARPRPSGGRLVAIAAPGRALSIGDAEFGERRRRVEAAAREAGLDALIAFSATNQRGASAFLTGYEPRFGPKEVAVVILIPGGKATLIAYAYWDEIRAMPWLDEVIFKADLLANAKLAAERLPHGAKRVGVAGYALFPAIFASAIANTRPAAGLEDATGLLMNQAVIKSATEIEILRECAAMTDAAVTAFLERAR